MSTFPVSQPMSSASSVASSASAMARADKAAAAVAKKAEKAAAKAAKEAQKVAEKAAKQAAKAAEKVAKEAAKAAIPKRPRGRPRKNPVTGSVASGTTLMTGYEEARAEEAGPILLPPPSVIAATTDDMDTLRARLAVLEATNASLLRRLHSIRDIVRV